jgi:hypothetical protein
MCKSQMIEKAERFADLAACAAVESAALARLGFRGDAESYAERAARLDAMAADYRTAARKVH